KSKEQLPTHGAPEPVSGQAVHQQCALPESVSGCAPTARPSAESSALYSRSTRHRNFEIGSSVLIPKLASFCGDLVCELRNRKDTSKSLFLVWLWFRSPHDGMVAAMRRTSETPH